MDYPVKWVPALGKRRKPKKAWIQDVDGDMKRKPLANSNDLVRCKWEIGF